MNVKGFFELGNAAFVSAELKYNKLIVPLNFIIDTGASKTIISDKDAKRIGIEYEKLEKLKKKMLGIGGEVEVFLLKNVELSFGEEIEKTDLYVIKHEKIDENVKRVPSILGRDIISKYNLVIEDEKCIQITDRKITIEND